MLFNIFELTPDYKNDVGDDFINEQMIINNGAGEI
jgi:hypothetical protein